MHYEWSALYETLRGCTGCGLAQTRSHVVIGDGNHSAAIMLVGEGPGREEDLQGIPFVGNAGKLLDKMLAAIALDRSEVYVCNIVKCRPPQNRVPADVEAMACLPYLRAQFALVRPKIIVCLGATAARYVYDESVRITRDRGVWKCKKGIWILPTYHPAALLRDEGKKRDAWEDFKKLKSKYLELQQKNMEKKE